MDIYGLLVLGHIIGTVLGVGGATFAEIQYTRFNRDNIIDDDERGTLMVTYSVMRFGLFILVFTGFGFLLYYRLNEMFEPLRNPQFWAKLTIVGILSVNALLLQARLMPMMLGTAVSFTSWYAALTLGVLHLEGFKYIPTMLTYIAAIPVVMGALWYVRKRLHPEPLTSKQ